MQLIGNPLKIIGIPLGTIENYWKLSLGWKCLEMHGNGLNCVLLVMAGNVCLLEVAGNVFLFHEMAGFCVCWKWLEMIWVGIDNDECGLV